MDTQNPEETERPGTEVNPDRRNFLNALAGAAFAVAAVGSIAVTVEYLSPNVLFEAPAKFRIGPPENFALNSITYLPEQQVYIVRGPVGFMAISAICTHLGCITQWSADLDMISCPCHGSRFRKNGTVEHGPAPRPLPNFLIGLTPDGNLTVDKLTIVPQTQIFKA